MGELQELSTGRIQCVEASVKPRLLDLFCGAGGAGMGYHRAGFEVVGVDIRPMPRYPFEFHQGDALEFCREHGHEFDVIHASPPCQAYSRLRYLNSNDHPNLIGITRELLQSIGISYVIENVPGAPMQGSGITLCGSMFGLKTLDGTGQLRRHRHFESNVPLWVPASCNHNLFAVPCFGGGGTQSSRKRCSGPSFREHHRKECMGIEWMNRHELSQAIPPAYCEYIGRQLMQYVMRARRMEAMK